MTLTTSQQENILTVIANCIDYDLKNNRYNLAITCKVTSSSLIISTTIDLLTIPMYACIDLFNTIICSNTSSELLTLFECYNSTYAYTSIDGNVITVIATYEVFPSMLPNSQLTIINDIACAQLAKQTTQANSSNHFETLTEHNQYRQLISTTIITTAISEFMRKPVEQLTTTDIALTIHHVVGSSVNWRINDSIYVPYINKYGFVKSINSDGTLVIEYADGIIDPSFRPIKLKLFLERNNEYIQHLLTLENTIVKLVHMNVNMPFVIK